MSCAGIEAIVIVGEDGGSGTQHIVAIQAKHRFLISSVCDPSWATQRLALRFPPKQNSCLPKVDVLKELSRGYKVASNHKACQQDLGLPDMMTIQRMRSRRHTLFPLWLFPRAPSPDAFPASIITIIRGARWREGCGVTCRVSRLNLRGHGWFQVVRRWLYRALLLESSDLYHQCPFQGTRQ